MNLYRINIIFLPIVTLCLSSCIGVPDGVEPVKGFELERYLGRWYEIARLDHSFERGLSKVTADYSMQEDGGVKVINRGFDALNNKWEEAIGKGYFVGKPDVGQLKVSFFGPFYGAYNVIALDKDSYQYSLVAGPDFSYLWILARSPQPDQSVIDNLIKKAKIMGFSVHDLILVTHE
jgi:apolipoprotein D and lipocalin family protein